MKLYLGPVCLDISFEGSLFPKLLPSLYFTTPVVKQEIAFTCKFTDHGTESLSGFSLLLEGKSDNPEMMPYNWFVWGKGQSELMLSIEYLNTDKITSVISLFNVAKKEIVVHILRNNPADIYEIDPLFQPLGSLLLVYFAHLTGGFMLHASGVVDTDGRTRLFTAVSETGKSTMARLWESKGALIINDDRLWLHKIDGHWYALSTPMIWYAQKPLIAKVDQIFLLKQSPENRIRSLSGINSQMQVMSNCIQHFHSREFTEAHLANVLDFTRSVPIFECAFKPDTEIVDIIRALEY